MKRAPEPAPAPPAKRPAYSSSEADELDVQLQKAKQEAWDARQEAEELRIRTSRESAEAKLALLREQQRAEETALQRDYLRKSEQRLREQLLQTPVPNLPAVLDHLEAENAIMVDGDAIYPI